MARKAKQQGSGNTETSAEVEQGIIKLAEQLGGFLGRVQRRADGLLDNETLKTQVAQIRDGANSLLKQVNASGAAVKKSAVKAVAAVTPFAAPKRSRDGEKAKAAKKTAPAPAKAPASPKREREGGMKARSGGVVDAPGKKHRQPPPQMKTSRHMSEPKAQQMGQKGIKGRMQRGRSNS